MYMHIYLNVSVLMNFQVCVYKYKYIYIYDAFVRANQNGPYPNTFHSRLIHLFW